MRRAFPFVDRGGAVWLYLLCVLAAPQRDYEEMAAEIQYAAVISSLVRT